MGIQWPKDVRRLAREGWEGVGVILNFQPTDSDGAPVLQPVVRVLGPDGGERIVSNGLSASTDDLRGRGDLLHLLVDPERDRAHVLAEPVSFVEHFRAARDPGLNPLKLARTLRGPQVDWGRRVQGVVVEMVPGSAGGTRTLVRFEGRAELVGPEVAGADPRRVGDPVDLGLGPDGGVLRAPEPHGEGGAALRAEMAVEPGFLKKVWNSGWV